MRVRAAELSMVLVLGIFSVYLMWKSAELNIGWVKGEGPGGGAWPFWLSAGMLICCVITLVRWFRRVTPESRSDELFMDRITVKTIGLTVGALFFMILGIHFVGIYVSMLLLLLFYMKGVGGHSWWSTASVTLGVPIGVFFFFEAGLKIILPKGYTEPLFYPLYSLIF